MSKKKKKTVGKSTNKKQTDISRKLKKALEIQGFPLEIKTYRAFLDKEWDSRLEEAFWDVDPTPGQEVRAQRRLLGRRPDEKPIRFVDVVAEKWIDGGRKKFSYGKIGIVAECKSHQTIPWVFYQEEKISLGDSGETRFTWGEHSSFSARKRVIPAKDSVRAKIMACSHHTAMNHKQIVNKIERIVIKLVYYFFNSLARTRSS